MGHVGGDDPVAEPGPYVAGSVGLRIFVGKVDSEGAIVNVGHDACLLFVVEQILMNEEVVNNGFVLCAPVELALGVAKEDGVGRGGEYFVQKVLLLAVVDHEVEQLLVVGWEFVFRFEDGRENRNGYVAGAQMCSHIWRHAYVGIVWKIFAQEPVEADADSGSVEWESGKLAEEGAHVYDVRHREFGEVIFHIPKAVLECGVRFPGIGICLVDGALQLGKVFVDYEWLDGGIENSISVSKVAVNAEGEEGVEEVVEEVGIFGLEPLQFASNMIGVDR